MPPESGHRFRVKNMRENKDLKRTERTWKIATRFKRHRTFDDDRRDQAAKTLARTPIQRLRFQSRTWSIRPEIFSRSNRNVPRRSRVCLSSSNIS